MNAPKPSIVRPLGKYGLSYELPPGKHRVYQALTYLLLVAGIAAPAFILFRDKLPPGLATLSDATVALTYIVTIAAIVWLRVRVASTGATASQRLGNRASPATAMDTFVRINRMICLGASVLMALFAGVTTVLAIATHTPVPPGLIFLLILSLLGLAVCWPTRRR